MRIPAPHGHLEGHLRPSATEVALGAAVLCHPHPLLGGGGTMHTKAVFRSAQALNDAGYHVLRFNFRGVGTSTGVHDDGVGERDDARAALDWMEERHPGLPLLLGGFSFGADVAMRVGYGDARVGALLALGLPFDKYDLSYLAERDARAGRPLLIVQGENDEFGSGATARAFAAGLGEGVEIAVINGADHYFHDHFDEMKEAVERFFSAIPARGL